MKFSRDSLEQFTLQLHTGSLPPPFSHQVDLQATKKEGEWLLSYQLHYLDRQDLSEEELFEEGFTMDDDFQWEGILPINWIDHLAHTLSVTTLPKDQEESAKQEPRVYIQAQDKKEGSLSGVPADAGRWEYLLQELLQALFELSGYEKPLEIAYRQVKKNEPGWTVSLEASFATRAAKVSSTRDGNGSANSEAISWTEVKEIMKRIYHFEFDNTWAKPNMPNKRGQYLFLGEGGWLPLPNSLVSETNEPANHQRIHDWFSQYVTI